MISIIFLIIGATIGTFILEVADPFLFSYLSHPELPASHTFKTLVGSRNIKAIFNFWKSNRFTGEHYILHSVLFQPVLLAVTYFALFIAASHFMSGLLIASTLSMVVRQVLDLRQFKHLNFWTWPIRGGMKAGATKIYLGIVSLLSLGTLLFLF